MTLQKILNYLKMYLNEDPKELFMATNELSWNIKKKVANINNAIYWVGFWI